MHCKKSKMKSGWCACPYTYSTCCYLALATRASFFAEFPTCVAENSAHAGSVILDRILSLDSGFIDNNSALQVLFCNLSTLLQSKLWVTKMLHILAKEIHTQIHNSMWDLRFTHILQRFIGTNFLLIMALLDNHAAKFVCA